MPVDAACGFLGGLAQDSSLNYRALDVDRGVWVLTQWVSPAQTRKAAKVRIV